MYFICDISIQNEIKEFISYRTSVSEYITKKIGVWSFTIYELKFVNYNTSNSIERKED